MLKRQTDRQKESTERSLDRQLEDSRQLEGTETRQARTKPMTKKETDRQK